MTTTIMAHIGKTDSEVVEHNNSTWINLPHEDGTISLFFLTDQGLNNPEAFDRAIGYAEGLIKSAEEVIDRLKNRQKDLMDKADREMGESSDELLQEQLNALNPIPSLMSETEEQLSERE